MENYRPRQGDQPLEMFEQGPQKALSRKADCVEKQYRLNLQPFVELYSEDVVRADYQQVAARLLTFNKNPEGAEKMGHIFESAFLDIGSRGNWFGEKSELVKASKYDDVINGVDMIATTVAPDNSARHIAISSDLTFSQSGVNSKFMRIKGQVYGGKLAEIKYFHSELTHVTGKLSQVPRTVVGLEPTNLNRMLMLWLRDPELAQLQYGSVIMQQIAIQCDALSILAGSRHAIARDAYRRTSDLAQILLRTNYKGIEAPDDKILNLIKTDSDRIRSDYI